MNEMDLKARQRLAKPRLFFARGHGTSELLSI